MAWLAPRRQSSTSKPCPGWIPAVGQAHHHSQNLDNLTSTEGQVPAGLWPRWERPIHLSFLPASQVCSLLYVLLAWLSSPVLWPGQLIASISFCALSKYFRSLVLYSRAIWVRPSRRNLITAFVGSLVELLGSVLLQSIPAEGSKPSPR